MAAHMEMMKAFDPLAYLAGVTLVILAALLAAYFPSRRATRVDPAATLRSE
jgi:ABC-type antimicrobial peptide transport system permease subunit